MAGSLCTRLCGYCGRCNAAWEEDDDRDPEPDVCEWCEREDCDGTCEEHFAEVEARR